MSIKKHGRVLVHTVLSEAIQYCQNQWNALTVFLTDGRLELSNNRAVRAIIIFVIGRKN
jgi:hypothetical protein